MVLVNLSISIVAILGLVLGGVLTVKGLSRVSSYLKITDFAVGFIIMAVATSLPELMVGVGSALAGAPTLSLGTVLGSNVLDLTLVIGLVILIARDIKVESAIAKRNSVYMFIIALLPLIFVVDGVLSRIEGGLLLGAFFFYMYTMLRQRAEFEKTIDHATRKDFIKNIALFVMGVAVLLLSVDFLIIYSSLLAVQAGIPLILIGIIMASFGTSLPELVFEAKAVLSGVKYMALGDLMGSVVANSSLVLGLTAIISPIAVANYFLFAVAAAFMIAALSIFTLLINRKQGFTISGGVILILLYIIFIMVELQAKGVLL